MRFCGESSLGTLSANARRMASLNAALQQKVLSDDGVASCTPCAFAVLLRHGWVGVAAQVYTQDGRAAPAAMQIPYTTRFRHPPKQHISSYCESSSQLLTVPSVVGSSAAESNEA
jgi:hypothetical protein